MVRNIIAVVLGLFVGGVCVGLIELIPTRMHPMPAEAATDPNVLKEWIGSLPLSALLLVNLAYVVGSFVGGFLATKIAPANAPTCASWVGGIQLTFGLINLLTIPHPVWFWPMLLVTFVPPALLGAYCATPWQWSKPKSAEPAA